MRRRTEEQLAAMKVEAAALRAAGVGSKRIAQQLGIGGALACELLRGVPVPGSLQRPRAKDDLREAAVLLRQQGRTYDEIHDELGVSKSSLSLWLRELPHPSEEQRGALSQQQLALPLDEPTSDAEIARLLRLDGWLLKDIATALGVSTASACRWTRGLPIPTGALSRGRSADEARAMGRAAWDRRLAEREVERQAIKGRASNWVGDLSDRELELIAITAYWCEGSKDKAYSRRERVTFINSDPGLIAVFLRWLRAIGVPEQDLQPGVSIHVSADVRGAEEFWSRHIGISLDRFSPPNLKKHNPRTVRKNTGDDYYGCLIIRVRQSRVLYQRIAGAWQGIADGHAGQPD
jgi:uncharacterized protein YerC